MNPVSIILTGAIGGILPTLAKLASSYAAATGPAVLPELNLIFAVVLFAVIGGIIAFATGQVDAKGALIAGIAAPGIITNLVAGATQKTTIDHASAWQYQKYALISRSYAGDLPNTAPQQTTSSPTNVRTVVVQPNVIGGLPANAQIGVTARIVEPSGSTSQVPVGFVPLTRQSTISLPAGTSQIMFGHSGSPEATGYLPLVGQDTNVKLDVTTKPASDFLWALGAPRTFDVVNVSPTLDLSRYKIFLHTKRPTADVDRLTQALKIAGFTVVGADADADPVGGSAVDYSAGGDRQNSAEVASLIASITNKTLGTTLAARPQSQTTELRFGVWF